MKVDADAIRNETLDVVLFGKTYKVEQLAMKELIAAEKVREKIAALTATDEQVSGFQILTRAYAPALPEDEVAKLGLRALFKLMQQLSAFQNGVAGDEPGKNALGGATVQ